MVDDSQRLGLLEPLGNNSVSLQLLATQDDEEEDEECLVFSLAIDQTQLDSRDQGQIDLDITVALARLQDVRFTCSQLQMIASIVVNCEANFFFDEITCSFDGTTPEPCKIIYVLCAYTMSGIHAFLGDLPLTINQLEYQAGSSHTLTIVVISSGISVTSEIEFDGQTLESLPRKYTCIYSTMFAYIYVRTVLVQGLRIICADGVAKLRVDGSF